MFPTNRMIGKLKDAFNDMEGKENTKKLTENCKDSGLLAVGLCGNTNEYLPSAGELMEAFKELEAINLSREFLGFDRIPLAWFWSSTVRDSDTIWVCYSDGGRYWGGCDGWRRYDGCVVPFL